MRRKPKPPVEKSAIEEEKEVSAEIEVKEVVSEEPKKSEIQAPRKKFSIDRQLSFKTFLISHFLILTVSIAFISLLAWILYKDNDQLNSQKYNPVTREPISFSLEINNPNDNLLVFDSSIVVSGKTDPLSTILITQNDQTVGVEADSQGNFTKVVTLSVGVNNIYLTAFDTTGSAKQVTRTVYYSEEKL